MFRQHYLYHLCCKCPNQQLVHVLNTFAPGITEEYITQVSEEIEGKVTKKLSQLFNRTESGILGALSKLVELLLDPQTRTLSGTVPGTSRNNDLENREPAGDRSQNDPHPEVEFCTRRTSNSTDSLPDETSHKHQNKTIDFS